MPLALVHVAAPDANPLACWSVRTLCGAPGLVVQRGVPDRRPTSARPVCDWCPDCVALERAAGTGLCPWCDGPLSDRGAHGEGCERCALAEEIAAGVTA
jgi:hypothetical protein